MKILVVSQYYYPEPFRVSDICEELVRQGHTVTVLTGLPNYPVGKIYPDYRHGEKRDEIINGVHVYRCFTIGRRSGALWRFANYYSFALSSSCRVATMKSEYDVVFVYQMSPVMMATAAAKYKRKHGKKFILYCLDLWPESLIAGNIKRGCFVYNFFHRVSEKIYRQADVICMTSKNFTNYFSAEFGIKADKMVYLPQYAEDTLTSGQADITIQSQENTVNFMFAGNIGIAQSVETILYAAKELQDMPSVKWHIVGNGSDYERCKELAEELQLQSVTFYGRKPLSEMPAYFAMADAMLVTLQNDPVLSLTVPGKVQSYMAAGKPIIAAINGETAEIIRDSGCGFCAQAEDYMGLADCVRRFVNEDDKSGFGKRALSYYEDQFDRKHFYKVLNTVLGDNIDS